MDANERLARNKIYHMCYQIAESRIKVKEQLTETGGDWLKQDYEDSAMHHLFVGYGIKMGYLPIPQTIGTR